MKLFQVFNQYGYPAGCDSNKLALFGSKDEAEEWIIELSIDLPVEEFTIKEKELVDSEKVEIIVELEGGLVAGVYCSHSFDYDVLDHDIHNDGDEEWLDYYNGVKERVKDLTFFK